VTRCLLPAIAALVLLGCSSDVAEVPRLTSRVNDYAGVLSAEDRAELEKTLATYETETTHQIAILTVKTLGGESIESFSLRVANTWRLGREGFDNGVLITLAPVDHAVRIELGKGINLHVSNADAQKIVETTMIPAFRQGDYSGGLRRGVERLLEACRLYKVPKPGL
jgi:uncharacterized protein